ncbi:MAG: uroporphyrinogen-III C-methyltransferase [Dechloromonas sp.]|nr:uroporphyrinogen-III C-methyltransferase [Dechloromonas sp.]
MSTEHTPLSSAPSPSATAAEPPTPSATRSAVSPWLLIALLAVLLAGWQWFETRQRLLDMQQEVARRLADADSAGKVIGSAQSQLHEQVNTLQGKLGGLESRLAEFQGQSEALNSLYQEMARGREEASLFEVEQAVILAVQQLQLTGNVQVAVLALQTADAQLARLDRPQHWPLRKTLAKDIAQLAALPLADVGGISVRLEQAIAGIDKLPLAAQGHVPAVPDERPAAVAATPSPNGEVAVSDEAQVVWWQQAWLQQAWRDLWREMKGLVRIQRFDGQDAVLLPPEQSYFLRENIKLRLLNARLAMLARDQWTFRNELTEADQLLQRYFLAEDGAVQALRAQLQKMRLAELLIELPSLSDSLRTVQALRLHKEKP